MTEPKFYVEGDFEFEFTPKGDPFEGILVTRAPELEPYPAEVKLVKPHSRGTYAKEASELCGMDEGDLRRALVSLTTKRSEEVAAAREAENDETFPTKEHPEVPEEKIEQLVGKPGVLDRYVEDAARISGVVREQEALKLQALVALSSQMDLLQNGKPLAANNVLTAGPGRGKNYLCDAVARQLPEEFYFPFESSSAKSLYYAAADDPKLLKHRWVYPNEAEGADLLVEMLRPLLSGGNAKHLTVNKDASGRSVGQQLTIEGPVSLTIPTVRNKLDSQLQTRMLVAELKDYEGRVADHSGAVSGLLSPDYSNVDYTENIHAWQAALRSLTGIRRVVLPKNDKRFLFDSDEVSYGARLWTNLMGLMSTHAWLEQRNRQIIELANGEKAIVAEPEDYEVAYSIFKATCERSVVNLSETHRKILNAVHDLQEEVLADDNEPEWDEMSFSQRDIATRAGISQSVVSQNKTFLVKSTKLLWEPVGGGLTLVKDAEPSWWDEGDLLLGLPRPEDVRAWWSEDGIPRVPESGDHTDHHKNNPVVPHINGKNADQQATDHGQNVIDHPTRRAHSTQDDRGATDRDRQAGDHENALSTAESEAS